MVKKKVDPRVRGLIEEGVRANHRSFFILVGDHGQYFLFVINLFIFVNHLRQRSS